MAIADNKGLFKGILIGAGLVWSVRHVLPYMAPAARPIARQLTKAALVGYERGREFSAEIVESMEDIVAEVQWELKEGKPAPDLEEIDIDG